MGALLALIPGKDLLYGALLVAFIAFGVYERHHLIAEGQQHELAALQASSDRLQKQTAAQTATLQAKATMAEQAYEKEVLANSNQPPVVVRMCDGPAAHSGGVVPAAGGQVAGNAPAGTVAGGVQQVPAGNSVGRDIGGMLSALAARADEVSAALREFQSR
jgi:hypothetical protein